MLQGATMNKRRAVGVVRMLHKLLKDIVYVVIDMKVIRSGAFHEAVEYSGKR